MLIYKALNQVMSRLGSIGKGQTNQNDGYSFRGIDDFYNAVHRPLVDAGVFSVPRVTAREEQIYTDQRGSRLVRVVLQVEYDFVALDGSKVTVGPIFAEGNDVSDKATNKALSSAHKYAMLQLFCVPTKGIDESDLTTIKISNDMSKVAQFNANNTSKVDYNKHPGLFKLTWGERKLIRDYDRHQIIEMIKQIELSSKERTAEVTEALRAMKAWIAERDTEA